MSPLCHHFEHAVPAKLGKLGHMGMEHVHAGIFVAEFQNAALGLSLDDRVGKLAGDKACACGVVVEEIRVQVEGVDQVEFQDVDQINADLFADMDLDRMVLVMEWESH